MSKIEWDVSDIDPTTMFPKDCRYYNGGEIAPPEVTKFWNDEESETNDDIRLQEKDPGKKKIIFIDRLRNDQ